MTPGASGTMFFDIAAVDDAQKSCFGQSIEDQDDRIDRSAVDLPLHENIIPLLQWSRGVGSFRVGILSLHWTLRIFRKVKGPGKLA